MVEALYGGSVGQLVTFQDVQEGLLEAANRDPGEVVADQVGLVGHPFRFNVEPDL